MGREQDSILIVEDDPTIGRLLEIHLGNEGYSVTRVGRGREALEVCRSTPPDLIVLDVRLPDISGYEVGMALRAAPDTQNIPIVVLTAFSERSSRLTAHNLVKAEYFLGKPFDIEELASVIRNQLSAGRRKGQYHPITNLPTGELVNAQLRELLSTPQWTLALIRVNGFEQFNQHYGVVVGEDVLKFTALLLCDVVRQQGDADDFVGQMVVGPYFIIISQPERIELITADLLGRFDADIKLHYSYRDIQDGSAPEMALSVAVISSNDGPFADIRQLTEVAEAVLPASPATGGLRRSSIAHRS